MQHIFQFYPGSDAKVESTEPLELYLRMRLDWSVLGISAAIKTALKVALYDCFDGQFWILRLQFSQCPLTIQRGADLQSFAFLQVNTVRWLWPVGKARIPHWLLTSHAPTHPLLQICITADTPSFPVLSKPFTGDHVDFIRMVTWGDWPACHHIRPHSEH